MKKHLVIRLLQAQILSRQLHSVPIMDLTVVGTHFLFIPLAANKQQTWISFLLICCIYLFFIL